MQRPERTAIKLVAVVAAMASLSFAAVPFYDWFCRVTGFGGTTGTAVVVPGQDEILHRSSAGPQPHDMQKHIGGGEYVKMLKR